MVFVRILITLYGIPNCDTVKKARKWLDNHGIEYAFHNYKTDGIPAKTLQDWVAQAGIDVLVNRRGTTWRALPDKDKNKLDTRTAIKLMRDHPSLIKRPVLDIDSSITVGFKADEYQGLLG